MKLQLCFGSRGAAGLELQDKPQHTEAQGGLPVLTQGLMAAAETSSSNQISSAPLEEPVLCPEAPCPCAVLVLWLGATPEFCVLLKAAVLARPGPAVSWQHLWGLRAQNGQTWRRLKNAGNDTCVNKLTCTRCVLPTH